MKTVHDKIQKRRSRQRSEFVRLRTERQNAARERKRQIEAGKIDVRRFVCQEDVEIPIQVIVLDHRTGTVIEADLFKRRSRSDSFSLVVGESDFVGNFGAARAMREIGKRILRVKGIV